MVYQDPTKVCELLDHITDHSIRCSRLLHTVYVAWCVGLSVRHVHGPCRNGWSTQGAVLNVDSGGPREPCIRWGHGSPWKWAIWGQFCISWTLCKSLAPRSRQISMQAPRKSVFMGWMLFLPPIQQCQSTEGTWPLCDRNYMRHFLLLPLLAEW